MGAKTVVASIPQSVIRRRRPPTAPFPSPESISPRACGAISIAPAAAGLSLHETSSMAISFPLRSAGVANQRFAADRAEKIRASRDSRSLVDPRGRDRYLHACSGVRGAFSIAMVENIMRTESVFVKTLLIASSASVFPPRGAATAAPSSPRPPAKPAPWARPRLRFGRGEDRGESAGGGHSLRKPARGLFSGPPATAS